MITLEEGAIGGFGSHVAHYLTEAGLLDTGLKVRAMVLPDSFIDQASPARMYEVAALSAAHIEAKVLTTLGITDLASKRA